MFMARRCTFERSTDVLDQKCTVSALPELESHYILAFVLKGFLAQKRIFAILLDFIFDMTIMVPASLIEGAFICPNKAEPGGTKLVWSISLTKQ